MYKGELPDLSHPDTEEPEFVSAMLSQLKLPPLEERRRVARLKLLCLIQNKSLNIDSLRYFKSRSTRGLRGGHIKMLMPMEAWIDLFKSSFSSEDNSRAEQPTARCF